MDLVNFEMSDKEILNQMCPTHKRIVISLGLDDKNDPHVMKCIQCLEYKKPQSLIYIEDLLQCDYTTIFRNWPIQEDHSCYRQLKQLDDISKWFSEEKEKQIDDFFTEFKSRIIQKIDDIKKDSLKKLENQLEDLYECLNNNKTELNYVDMELNDGSEKPICEFQNHLNEMTDLILALYNNNIGTQGIEQLTNVIGKFLNIKELQLSLLRCQINSYGVKVILNSIQNYEKITSLALNFSESNLGIENTDYITNALQKFSKLTSLTLSLSKNMIGDLGLNYLSKGIENCQNISTLVLVLGRIFIMQDIWKFYNQFRAKKDTQK
ncbi:hypothetical protein ABPG73_006697 [Tetrahymena malaccensis]